MSLRCERCEKADFEIVKGWESDKALRCPKCGQYHYWVFGVVHCVLYYTGKKFNEQKAKSLLDIPLIMGELK